MTSVLSVPDTVLSSTGIILFNLHDVLATKTVNYFLQFTEGKTKAERGYAMSPRPRSSEC